MDLWQYLYSLLGWDFLRQNPGEARTVLENIFLSCETLHFQAKKFWFVAGEERDTNHRMDNSLILGHLPEEVGYPDSSFELPFSHVPSDCFNQQNI